MGLHSDPNLVGTELTDVLVKYGSPRENTHVLLYEVSYDNWAKGGKTYNQRKKEAQ